MSSCLQALTCEDREIGTVDWLLPGRQVSPLIHGGYPASQQFVPLAGEKERGWSQSPSSLLGVGAIPETNTHFTLFNVDVSRLG